MEKVMKKEITFERIPELTEEEQEVLDSIKKALKDIGEGKRGMPIEEVKRRILKYGRIDVKDEEWK